MGYKWTESQLRRLIELDGRDFDTEVEFETREERDSEYKKLNTELVNKSKENLEKYRMEIRRPALEILKEKLAKKLTDEGFIQVSTPIILSKKLLNNSLSSFCFNITSLLLIELTLANLSNISLTSLNLSLIICLLILYILHIYQLYVHIKVLV